MAPAGTASIATTAANRVTSVRRREVMDRFVGRSGAGTQLPGRLSGRRSAERQLAPLLDRGADRADRRALAFDLRGRVAVHVDAALHRAGVPEVAGCGGALEPGHPVEGLRDQDDQVLLVRI